MPTTVHISLKTPFCILRERFQLGAIGGRSFGLFLRTSSLYKSLVLKSSREDCDWCKPVTSDASFHPHEFHVHRVLLLDKHPGCYCNALYTLYTTIASTRVNPSCLA